MQFRRYEEHDHQRALLQAVQMNAAETRARLPRTPDPVAPVKPPMPEESSALTNSSQDVLRGARISTVTHDSKKPARGRSPHTGHAPTVPATTTPAAAPRPTGEKTPVITPTSGHKQEQAGATRTQ